MNTSNQPATQTFTKNYDYVMLDDDHRMTQQMKHTYCYLLRFHESGLTVFPSVSNIARYTGYSERTIKRVTESLVEIGLISKQRRMSNSNIYTIHPYSQKVVATEPGKQAISNGVTMSISGTAIMNGDSQTLPSDSQTLPLVTDRHTMRLINEIKNEISLKEGQNQKPISQNNSLDGSKHCSEQPKGNCDKREPIKSNCEEKPARSATPEPEPECNLYDYEDDLPV
ncbi:helix-turn-helix domain-containing protein [Escherichia coli]|uniref:helix-turn-helix domain-containing protein n=1 Tax=Escherichia coli TaxID=562 RepID=UPI00184E1062|nr:helix-turn-helix domain-containing protein [Escherichia coli]EFM6520585.1 helix-turn-helix domain-containing protein [Escherichia coli]EIV9094751.1 helix-turn-helix domain-containing protein [Escherichia coli]HCL9682005.1 helix-turn-helix domain-containing protein [Escherichia coli]